MIGQSSVCPQLKGPSRPPRPGFALSESRCLQSQWRRRRAYWCRRRTSSKRSMPDLTLLFGTPTVRSSSRASASNASLSSTSGTWVASSCAWAFLVTIVWVTSKVYLNLVNNLVTACSSGKLAGSEGLLQDRRQWPLYAVKRRNEFRHNSPASSPFPWVKHLPRSRMDVCRFGFEMGWWTLIWNKNGKICLC